MNDIRNALADFWGGFVHNKFGTVPDNTPIPAYHEEYVPENATFPYITYQIALPNYFDGTILSASIWDRNEQPGFFGLVDDVLEQARENISAGGVSFKTTNGEFTLYRGSGDFIQYMNEPDDQFIVRGIILCELRARTP